MDPGLFPRYISLVIQFWVRKMGKRRFWALFACSTLLVIVLIVLKV